MPQNTHQLRDMNGNRKNTKRKKKKKRMDLDKGRRREWCEEKGAKEVKEV